MKNKNLFIWSMSSTVFVICIPIFFAIVTGIWPKVADFAKSMLPIILLFYPSAIFSAAYIPIFGKKATYLTMLSGHVSNITIPCMLNSINILDNSSSIDQSIVLLLYLFAYQILLQF